MAEEGESANLAAVICCCCPCITALIAAPAVYLAFGIYFLVSDVDVCNKYSLIWIFSLLAILDGVVFGTMTKMMAKPDPSKSQVKQMYNAAKWNFVSFAISLGITIFGGIALYGYCCDDMKGKGLYIWAMLTFYIRAVLLGLVFLMLCIVGLMELVGMEIPEPDLPESEEREVMPVDTITAV
jgi:hypothetical protein